MDRQQLDGSRLFLLGAASFVPVDNSSPRLTSSFRLHPSNLNPRDLATDGFTVWVVDDSTVDFVYAYTTAGGYLGRWQIDSANSRPTGITIDPTAAARFGL